jgi:3-oxoacid CoA-transferase A subunit
LLGHILDAERQLRLKTRQLLKRPYCAGQIELEVVPQDTLAERFWAAGAGNGPFFTPTAFGTKLAEGKETCVIDGKGCVLKQPLHGDLAFIEAHLADALGNLTFRYAGRNFAPAMVMAGKITVAQVDRVVEVGEIAPEFVMTPGILCNKSLSVNMSALTCGQLTLVVANCIPSSNYVNLGVGESNLGRSIFKTRTGRCRPY